MAQEQQQQNTTQAYQKPPKSGFRIFAGKLLKGIVIGVIAAAVVGAVFALGPVSWGIAAAGALHSLPLLGSLVTTHAATVSAAATVSSSTGAASVGIGTASATVTAAAAHTVAVGWGALLGLGAAAGAFFGGVVGIFKGERQSKQNKQEQAMARAQQQEQGQALAPQQTVGQGTTLDNANTMPANNQVPDAYWQQKVAAQRGQQASAAVPPL